MKFRNLKVRDVVKKVKEKLLRGEECNEPYWIQALATGKIENNKAFTKSLSLDALKW